MARVVVARTLNTIDGTVVSEPFSPLPDSHYLTLGGKRRSGSATVTVTLQGSFGGRESADADWVDTGWALSLANGNAITGTPPSETVPSLATFPLYRISMASTGVGEADAYVHFM